MKSLITVALTLAALSVSTPSYALVRTQWNFNSTTPDNNTGTGTLTPSTGTGTATNIGGTTQGFNSGVGSSDPAASDNSGWNITAFPTQGTGNKTSGVQFAVSTVGLINIIVNYDIRHSNTSASNEQFQYSTDGTNFIDSTVFTSTLGDTWVNGRSVDLSSISAANNNANFAFRVVSTFAPSTSGYAATNSGSTYGTTGTWRFDVVTVNGTATPVPFEFSPAVGVVVLGGLFLGKKVYKSLKNR